MNGSHKTSSLFLVLTLLAGLLGLAQPAQASPPLMADWWVTNGTVYATALSGTTLYIGGDFTYVGPPTGSFAALDAAGAPDMGFPPVNGTIQAIAPDGAGGWYVGGTFTHVGGHPRNNLAHLKADKSLDFAWNPNADSTVYALAVSGSTVYAGGNFTSIGGQSRNRIAALDASTGSVTDWDPDADSTVYALAVSGSTVYAGGNFITINGATTRNYIAALDASTGTATTWDPHATGSVRALTVEPPISGVSGSTVYAGGYFTSIGGQTRWFIAALDASTGTATAWAPNANGSVRALAVDPPISGVSGSTVYAGGNFTSIGGQTRNNIAAMDASSGLATDWDPNANNIVYALAVAPPISGVSGSTVYAGGDFTSIGGLTRNRLAALDTSTGSATSWNPNANSTVWALAVEPPISGVSGSTVYAGGSFASIGGLTRNRLAALDTSTGSATSWNPNANSTVWALAVEPPISGVSSSTVYAGGHFTAIGGQTRNRIAALDTITGSATAWDPNAGGIVRALVVAPPISGVSSSTVYAGGDFTRIGGQTRNRIAALDTSTGSATAWDPNADGIVRALAVRASSVYAGGDFTSIGGQPRNHIASLNASTGLAWNWNANANGSVRALAMRLGFLYVGGDFTSIGGQPRNYIAALTGIGSTMTWDPNANNTVYALAVSDSTVYAGGNFTSIGGQTRNRIAALDATINTNNATTWNPNTNNTVYALAAESPILGMSSSTVYAGGGFTGIAGRPNSFIAALRDGAATCQSAGSGGTWQVSNWSGCGSAIPGDGDSVDVQAGHTLTLYGSLAANDLTTHAGGALELPLGSSLTVEGSVTHNGRLAQTLAVPTTATTTFLNLKNADGTTDKFFGASLTPAGDMGNTRVSILGNQDCTTEPTDALIQRCFNITPTTSRNATLRLYYTQAELNGQTYNALKLWHWSSGWAQVGDSYTYSPTCDAGQQDCWMEAQNVSSYSPFGAGSGSQPTAVRLHSFAARAVSAEGGPALFGMLLLGLGGVGVARRKLRG